MFALPQFLNESTGYALNIRPCSVQLQDWLLEKAIQSYLLVGEDRTKWLARVVISNGSYKTNWKNVFYISGNDGSEINALLDWRVHQKQREMLFQKRQEPEISQNITNMLLATYTFLRITYWRLVGKNTLDVCCSDTVKLRYLTL